MEKIFKYFIPGVWISLCLTLWVFIVVRSPVTADDGYYLYHARLILEQGLTPITDFIAHYSPGYAYIYAAVFACFGNSYTVIMSLMMVLGCATIIMIAYDTFKRYQSNVSPIIASSFMIPAWLIYGGAQPYLEPLVIFFSVVAYIIYRSGLNPVRLRIFLTGLFLGASLMCKQAALMFVLVTTVQVVIDLKVKGTRHVLAAIVLYWFGVGIPFLVFCGISGLQVFPTAFYLANFAHDSYGYDPVPLSYAIRMFFQMYPITVPLLASFLWVLIRHSATFSLPLMYFASGLLLMRFQTFDHYYLLILPWGTLLLIQTLRDIHSKVKITPRACLICVAVLAPILGPPVYRKGKFYSSRFSATGKLFRSFYGGLGTEAREVQVAKATEIDSWRLEKPIIILGDPAQQYLVDSEIADKRADYGFTIFNDPPRKLIRAIRSGADFVCIETPSNRRNVLGSKDYLLNAGFKPIRVSNIMGETLTHLSLRTQLSVPTGR